VRAHIVSLLLVVCDAAPGMSQSAAPLLLRRPAISATQLVFTYGGNLWIVSPGRRDAQRLTAGPERRRGGVLARRQVGGVHRRV